MLECIIFITHNFNKEFLNTLSKMDIINNNYKIIVLVDDTSDCIIPVFSNIEIIKINRIHTSYDHLGHSMYINYFKQHYDVIKEYTYIWIIENDVYYPGNLLDFIMNHSQFDYDILVGEHGLRSPNWFWKHSLMGFSKNYDMGVLAVIMRFSQRFLLNLIDNLDSNYCGYLEILIPNICKEYSLSINQFLPELCGILTPSNEVPLMRLIKEDIENNTRNYLEDKIYHPVKL